MTEFKLPDMSCNHCVRSIGEALKTADPTAEFVVDLPSHTVQVLRSGQPVEVLAAALREAGYPPAA
jgi:copper chaperone